MIVVKDYRISGFRIIASRIIGFRGRNFLRQPVGGLVGILRTFLGFCLWQARAPPDFLRPSGWIAAAGLPLLSKEL